MKKSIKILTFFFFFILIKAHCQLERSFFIDIEGQWEGKGKLFDQPASFYMQWEHVLENKFIKLSFKNQFIDKSGIERILESNAYYNLKSKKGFWVDSRGVMFPLSIELYGLSMTVYWGDDTTEKGKTIYLVKEKTEVSVEDFVFSKDSYVLFGNAIYQKK